MSSISIFSQEVSTKEVDETTLKYYNNQQWNELISYGENIEIDYYYFDVRIGVAYFNERQYHSAEAHFKKAIAKNDGDFAKKYLFWTYYNLGENILAERVFDELSEEGKQQVNYKKTAIEFVYVEGGAKMPSVANIENTLYGNVMLKHRLGDNIRVLHSINSLSQSQSFQDYNSFQYHIFGSYYFNASTVGLGAIFSTSDFSQIVIDDAGDYTENITSNTNSFYLFYAKRFNRLKLNASFNYVNQNATSEVKNSNPPSTVKTDVSESAAIPSVGLSYTPAFLKDRVSLGAEVFIPIGENQTSVIVKPYLNIFILDRLWINTSYLQVPDQLFVDYSSEIYYNTPDLAVNRFVATMNFVIIPKITAKFTYTNESYDFISQDFNYNINSLFLGIQFKF
jgi:hypothetical protein